MVQPADSHLPTDTPQTKSVKGVIALSWFGVFMGILLAVGAVFSSRPDPLWRFGYFAGPALVVINGWRLVVEYRRPPGDDRYMRLATRLLTNVITIIAVAIWLWLMLHQIYGFSIKP
jgi:hypothetical protein